MGFGIVSICNRILLSWGWGSVRDERPNRVGRKAVAKVRLDLREEEMASNV